MGIRILLLLSFFLLGSPSFAKQTYFNKRYIGVGVEFDYRWLDYKGNEHAVEFTLRQDDTNLGEKEFRPFDNKDYQAYAFKKAQDKAREISKYNMKVRLKRTGGSIGLEIKGRVSAQTRGRIEEILLKEYKQAQEDYMKEKMYEPVPHKEGYIQPSYAEISKRYVRVMAPVARALMKKIRLTNERDVANQVLSFLQSIPYDTLQSRYTSNGAGFQTPVGVLSGNKGDCDSKSVAFAAIMKNIYPKSRVLLVTVPGHALVGFNFGQKAGDKVLKVKGRNFVLAEPVGPKLAPLGQISRAAEQGLSSKQFYYQEMPR